MPGRDGNIDPIRQASCRPVVWRINDGCGSVTFRLFLILVLALTVSGCSLAEGIFKAGLWVGAIMVLLVVVLIVWIVRKARR